MHAYICVYTKPYTYTYWIYTYIYIVFLCTHIYIFTLRCSFICFLFFVIFCVLSFDFLALPGQSTHAHTSTHTHRRTYTSYIATKLCQNIKNLKWIKINTNFACFIFLFFFWFLFSQFFESFEEFCSNFQIIINFPIGIRAPEQQERVISYKNILLSLFCFAFVVFVVFVVLHVACVAFICLVVFGICCALFLQFAAKITDLLTSLAKEREREGQRDREWVRERETLFLHLSLCLLALANVVPSQP